MTKNIKYYCNDLPSLNENNTYNNLFDISYLDSIEQIKENIPLLLEKLYILKKFNRKISFI